MAATHFLFRRLLVIADAKFISFPKLSVTNNLNKYFMIQKFSNDKIWSRNNVIFVSNTEYLKTFKSLVTFIKLLNTFEFIMCIVVLALRQLSRKLMGLW